MSGYGSYTDNQPLRYWNGRPIYLQMYLTLAVTAGILLMLLLGSAGVPLAGWLMFHPVGLRSGFVWQPFTWPLVNEIDFFTPFALLCFYSFGVEVEKYLGRKTLLFLCAALTFVPVLFYSCFYLLSPIPPGPLFGIFYLTAGLLIAYATLYPDVEVWGWIPLKWFAFVCISCGSITFFPSHNWTGLSLLWLECVVAFLFVKYARGHLDFNFNWRRFWPRKKSKLRVLPRPETARTSRRVSTAVADQVDEAEAEINALLDKIASSGLQSLSGSEKARLETLRQRMLRKES